MKQTFKIISLLAMMVCLSTSLVLAGAERDPLKPRVPKDQRGAAKKMKSPFYKKASKASPGIVAEGKKIFEGKGTCFNCHGKSGKGDGPAGKVLNPAPRDFTNCKFHKKRKDGELFWVIKNGSPGTGMVPLIPSAITEEEAWKVIAYERSFCKK
ncbi:MAG: c-type cytochrome [Nitrospirales bacterium]|nr:c-type cytochrome [Nitrospirales bacterium]